MARRAAEASGLDDEQTEAVVGIATSGRRAHLVVGPAGTGKTRTMRAVAHLADAAEIRLRALAVIQDVTDRLRLVIGVDDDHARNIHAFLQSEPDESEKGAWWIIDEASMVSTRSSNASAGSTTLNTPNPNVI